MTKRTYTLGKRAEAMEETRRRITAATVELHEEVGPARTTVSEIARRAGVERVTVYKHFPDEVSLFSACQGHWLAQNPPPDLFAHAAVGDPDERTRAVLGDLYGWYRRGQAMTRKVMRDADGMPALREVVELRQAPLMEAVAELLLRGRGARGRRRDRTRATIGLALAFHTWDALAVRGGLSDAEAAAVAAAAIAAA